LVFRLCCPGEEEVLEASTVDAASTAAETPSRLPEDRYASQHEELREMVLTFITERVETASRGMRSDLMCDSVRSSHVWICWRCVLTRWCGRKHSDVAGLSAHIRWLARSEVADLEQH
jgi:hypothetical protein